MNKAFIRKWIKALKSGDYKQSSGGLRDPMSNTYCFLGVAIDVALKEDPTLGEWSGRFFIPRINEGVVYGLILPRVLQHEQWLGKLASEGGNIYFEWKLVKTFLPFGYDYNNTLISGTRLNDDGLSFKTLAAILKAKLKAMEET